MKKPKDDLRNEIVKKLEKEIYPVLNRYDNLVRQQTAQEIFKELDDWVFVLDCYPLKKFEEIKQKYLKGVEK